MLLLLATAAHATPGFDATTPMVAFDGRETWTQAEDVRLWDAVERWMDPDRTLFTQEAFNSAIAWQDTDYSPWIATAFGDSTPHSSVFLLHVGIHEPVATGTPILMVCGAGDNGSRGFVTLATHIDRLNRPVYALTFAHPHGDVFEQAEVVADAIEVIKQRTGAPQVDLIGHSKGGIAATIYASNLPGTAWGASAYESVGTHYRGDVRRLVLIATPLAGVDTSYRWTGLNLYSLDPDQALSVTSWDRYYPSTTAFPLVFDSLVDQDMMPDGADYFPGQRQLLARQPYSLAGQQPWLGLYAAQPDWLTTYEGGLGFLSRSDGIDAAKRAGGNVIEKLKQAGVDPSVEVFQLAGTNPLMPNGDSELAAQFESLGSFTDYPGLLASLTNHGVPVSADADEFSGLDNGWLVVGEITGPSDGLVFVSSAASAEAVNARGAVVTSHEANLSHLDLLYASPITGQLLIDAADAGGPDEQWMRGVGKRYILEDTIGWVDEVTADEPGTTTTPGDTGDTGDTGLPTEETGGTGTTTDPTDGGGTTTGGTGEFDRPCGGCDPVQGAPRLLPALLAVLMLRRRKA
ncbi:MAG: hypothetical protein KC621_33945 [Myxococcales bacterium]|nr:hypothetical protein [Myxococcales bacterium]